ncbi:DUF7345 domain-containing protein [Haloarcula salinisoli]|uniref:PGF-CTERM sorting domain-containing protein n=1 Tax=Haloarcula salinisoli TaxID=2487746 RepID=A0A8J7YEK7_9EURY|nr:PGF-CTERM sorting domain-containing protein [Halomicroarcula salinisoli]MBX0286731.1 PGF-CTERM sorting domain-containing protein [Halomicroarcula salinisoli]MBX0304042.1 PGF-CTERM sorting domain-containing protein [Halomicroarcula salinisoli]
MRVRQTLLTSVVLAAVLVGAAVAPAGAAQTGDAPDESLTVDIAADGDAAVTVVSTFDLDDESEQAAFDELRSNETARDAYAARQTARWRSLANDTSARTDREMAVTNSSLSLSRTNATGVATFSVTWAGLAAAEDGMLTFGEPFASTESLDRKLVVVVPERYQVTSVSPGPANNSDGRLVYAADAELDGLSIVATSTTAPTGTPAPSPTSTTGGTTSGSGPGFGAVGALAALAMAGLLAGRHR